MEEQIRIILDDKEEFAAKARAVIMNNPLIGLESTILVSNFAVVLLNLFESTHLEDYMLSVTQVGLLLSSQCFDVGAWIEVEKFVYLASVALRMVIGEEPKVLTKCYYRDCMEP
jgi:hypothetical protein